MTDLEFSGFYSTWRPRLLIYVRSALRSRQLTDAQVDAEAVAQETFEEALRQWPTIEVPENWIYVVATNKVNQHHRRQRMRARREAERSLDQLCSVGRRDPTYDGVLAIEVIDRIRTLPHNQRIATYLRHVQQWTGPEIAAYLNVATSTADVHVHRGTRRVRAALTEREFPPGLGMFIGVVCGGIAAWLLPATDGGTEPPLWGPIGPPSNDVAGDGAGAAIPPSLWLLAVGVMAVAAMVLYVVDRRR